MSDTTHAANNYEPLFGDPVSGWFGWFAWRPVETVDRGWRWLRIVHRRRIQKKTFLDGGADFWFQHAVSLTPKEGTTHE